MPNNKSVHKKANNEKLRHQYNDAPFNDNKRHLAHAQRTMCYYTAWEPTRTESWIRVLHIKRNNQPLEALNRPINNSVLSAVKHT